MSLRENERTRREEKGKRVVNISIRDWVTSDPEGGFIVFLLWLDIHSLLTLSA